MANNIIHGARCKLKIAKVGSDTAKVVGIFSDVSYGVSYDVQPAFILGRFSAAELTYVGMDVVEVNATGFRVLDNGAFVSAGMPKLNELINQGSIHLEIEDTGSGVGGKPGKILMKVSNVKVASFSSGQAARSQSTFSVRFMGTEFEDESTTGSGSENSKSAKIDDGQ
jgi:hypothetical protein